MRSLAMLKSEAFSRVNEGNFTVLLAELQKIRYNQNMSNNFIYRVAKEKDTGMGLMPEKSSDTGFHRERGLFKGSNKGFRPQSETDTS